MTAAILAIRPTAPLGIALPKGGTTDLVRLLALERLPASRQRLVCHWHRDADGRLACRWEPDIAPFRTANPNETQDSVENERTPLSATAMHQEGRPFGAAAWCKCG
jgi:hypothetical protein